MICSGAYRHLDNILAYSRYHHPQVRALVWSLISPGLTISSNEFPACISSDWCRDLYERLQPSLDKLDKDAAPLTQWLEQYPSWRLGVRFEAFWAFILKQLQNQKKLLDYTDHIQIQESIKQGPFKKTVGELDFVYLDSHHRLNHLEIAVKFYLLKPDEIGYQRLVGPNGGDWYERKLLHLFNQQLPLSATLEAREKLADRFQLPVEDICCQQQGLIKGMIFYPVTDQAELNVYEQQRINPACLTGIWAREESWQLADPQQSGYWVILEKLDWLVPQVYHPSMEPGLFEDILYSSKEMAYKLKIHFHNSRRSVLIARMEYDADTRLWLERQRLMVVDKYWPTYKRPQTLPSPGVQASGQQQ